jgi:hypothetical protein
MAPAAMIARSPAGLDDLGADIGVKVHADEGSGAASHHLPARELNAGASEPRVDEPGFSRKR